MNANVELLTRNAARDLARSNGQNVVPIIRNNADWYQRRTCFYAYDEETTHLTGPFSNVPRNFFGTASGCVDTKSGIYQRFNDYDGTLLRPFIIKGLVQEQKDQLPYEADFVKRCARAFCNSIICCTCEEHHDKCQCDGLQRVLRPPSPQITTIFDGVRHGIEETLEGEESPSRETGLEPLSHGTLATGCSMERQAGALEGKDGNANTHDDDEDICPLDCGCGYLCPNRARVLGREDQQAVAEDPEQGPISTSRTTTPDSTGDCGKHTRTSRMIRPSEAARLVADQRIYKDWETIPVYNLSMNDKFSYIENYLIK